MRSIWLLRIANQQVPVKRTLVCLVIQDMDHTSQLHKSVVDLLTNDISSSHRQQLVLLRSNIVAFFVLL